jgi:uncharacterized protein YjbJ (UPF0337 family)
MPDADNIKNTATNLAGKAKEVAGEVTRNKDLEIDGQIERATATARKNSEDEHDLFG